ncbi:ABC transporter substrate-binding protein [bacterium]|nr:ABC transporter substrate-binding protein [bacterium]
MRSLLMRGWPAAFLLLSLLFTVQFASAAEPAPGFTDGSGQRVDYGQGARRIVSLAPNVTEMLCFLGYQKRIVGRSSFCNYPPAISSVPSVGGMVDTSLESILALDPQLVVAYQGNSLELVRQLREAGLSVVAFKEAASLPEIGKQMHQLWRVISTPGSPAPEALEKWDARLAAYQRKKLAPATQRPATYYGYPGELSYTCGPGSFIDDLIKLAGGRNVVSDKNSERWPQVGAEFILAAQPQWMLLGTSCTGGESFEDEVRELRSSLRHDPVWSQLPAVNDGHVVILDSDVLLRPGPRILDALQELRAALEAAGS